MTVAVYARYSSDLQDAQSIKDQVARLLLPLHDEIFAECDLEYLPEVDDIFERGLRAAFARIFGRDVPATVRIRWGTSLGCGAEL